MRLTSGKLKVLCTATPGIWCLRCLLACHPKRKRSSFYHSDGASETSEWRNVFLRVGMSDRPPRRSLNFAPFGCSASNDIAFRIAKDSGTTPKAG